jgi:hypothetical protein
MGEMSNAYTILIRSRKGRDKLEGVEVNRIIILKSLLKEIGWDSVDWINLAQDRDQ